MLITAHSGCDSTPDNSMDFVRHALQLQVDALEVDVWRKCGKLILSHDEPVDMNHPLLEEVFALVKEHPSMMVNCDLKEKGLDAKASPNDHRRRHDQGHGPLDGELPPCLF